MRIGTDIVEVSRIVRAISNEKQSFLERVFTYNEIIKINIDEPNFERASGFWAAKESLVKAIGCGFRHGIRFHDIEITHDEYGCPGFIISGKLKEILEEKRITNLSLSISHCRTHEIAATIVY